MDDSAHTAPHIVDRSGKSFEGLSSSHHLNRYLLMRSLWRGLLRLHGHVIDSRRALGWADPATWKAWQNTERTKTTTQPIRHNPQGTQS
jgi:hypothetical protein